MRRSLHLVVAAILASASTSLAQVTYVDATLATGANDGSSWADAYRGSAGLRAAFASTPPGGEIWLGGGTYLPSDAGDACARFLVSTDQITVRGGFLGGESSPLERPDAGANPSILSGDLLGDDDGTVATAGDNSATVLRVESIDLYLDRVTIQGAGPDGTCSDPSARPVALSTVENPGALTLHDCVFEECFGDGVAPDVGLFPSDSRRIRVEGTLFRDITGSGLSVPWMVPGEAVNACRFERCGIGLAVGPLWPVGVTFKNCVALDCRYGFSFGNDKTQPFNPVLLRNCTLAGNSIAGVNADSRNPFGLVGPVAVRDSIVWDNAAPFQGFDPIGQVLFAVEDSIVQGGWPSPTAFDVDPRFEDAAGGDLSLQPASPAIDRASGQGVASNELDVARRHRAVDVAGVPNLGGSSVDLGAIEFTSAIGENDGCDPVPNSTGVPGRIFAQGSTAATDGDLALDADRLPSGQFGMFLVSRQLGFMPMAGGLGTLCLGGNVGRLNRPGQIQSASPAGRISITVDPAALPQASAFVSVQPGETWRFQLWHRDLLGGAPTNNLTGLVSIRFD
ncbi:MAG: right-handed parallel beta-helix repeat-containing protein [Planctomycetota bacterium]